MASDFRQKSDRLATSRSSGHTRPAKSKESHRLKNGRLTVDLSLPANQRSATSHKPKKPVRKPRTPDRTRNARYEGEKTPAQRRAELKRLERMRKHRDRTIRRVLFYVLAMAVLGGMIYGGLALVRAPWFDIKSYEIVGNTILTPQQIGSLIHVEPDQTVLTVHKKDLVDQLMQSPWIKSAEVKRKLPNTLVVTIVERSPALRVPVNDKTTWVVSADGVWLGMLSVKENKLYSSVRPSSEAVTVRAKDLVRLIDVGPIDGAEGKATKNPIVINALKVYAGSTPDLREQISYISAPEVALTKIYTKSKVEISVGEAQDMKIKSEIALAILTEQKGKVVLINVRSVEKPTWRGLTE